MADDDAALTTGPAPAQINVDMVAAVGGLVVVARAVDSDGVDVANFGRRCNSVSVTSSYTSTRAEYTDFGRLRVGKLAVAAAVRFKAAADWETVGWDCFGTIASGGCSALLMLYYFYFYFAKINCIEISVTTVALLLVVVVVLAHIVNVAVSVV